ncbi:MULTISPECIES: SDR family NAD(P)-dependent oxidoreductase [Nonomuraea]|uniref:NAD(P)-dependent dehydrogenase (Short-subunit alcohol dehydrogenase family) n=2 Tax=Nonomuraea TaxID=83681 RepID=A0A7W5V6X3_9ACTN|nr:SDR family oxidoreductase [Nonomuraea dietziae]MBB3730289.1 NAD(P)-dependent dehydrogenase (short-subunit alcohol dehydrogenase family) [Nonomuraea dietziae]
MRTALVTGASRGIGRAAAVRLARDGFHVVVNYAEDEVAASEVVSSIEREGGSAVAVRAALGTPGAVTALASELTSLDVLVNNAGVGLPKPLSEVTPEEYDRVFAVNVRELFFLTQRLLPLIPSGGRIINVTSGVTRISYPEGIAYAMTKGAVQTFTLALAKELGPRGITVNNVAPGIIDTDANASWLDEGGRAYAASRHAVNRVGEPHEIADAIGFLASPQASFITGTTIDATGGGNL